MPDTNKEQQALNALEKADNAVGEAGDHPSSRMIEQADNSLVSAEIAVRQAKQAGGESADLTRAAEQIEEERAALDDSSS